MCIFKYFITEKLLTLSVEIWFNNYNTFFFFKFFCQQFILSIYTLFLTGSSKRKEGLARVRKGVTMIQLQLWIIYKGWENKQPLNMGAYVNIYFKMQKTACDYQFNLDFLYSYNLIHILFRYFQLINQLKTLCFALMHTFI